MQSQTRAWILQEQAEKQKPPEKNKKGRCPSCGKKYRLKSLASHLLHCSRLMADARQEETP